MSHIFTRQELYGLVWSEPMRNLAEKYGISDRGLAKACAAANIPVPVRGYWAKSQAGRPVLKQALPPRGFGQSNEVIIGGGYRRYYCYHDGDLLNDPIPAPPVFEMEMDAVRARVTALVNKAPLPKSLDRLHPLIAKLLRDDEARLQKTLASAYPSSWDKPKFDMAFERRRLKILNGLFTCLHHCGMKPSYGGKEARDLSVMVGNQRVSFSLDSVSAENQLQRERAGYSFDARGEHDKMYLALTNWRFPEKSCRSWQDGKGDALEKHMREIVTELIVAGEESYRQGLIQHREWMIKRKADLLEKKRQAEIEAERKRLERQARLEQRRIDHLLGQADALHRAGQIRAYVTTIRDVNKTAPQPMSDEELDSWAEWALAQADRIDPVASGSYRTRPAESGE